MRRNRIAREVKVDDEVEGLAVAVNGSTDSMLTFCT